MDNIDIMVFKRKTFHFQLHLNAESGSFKFAKELRNNSTKAEILLWNKLKGRKLSGYKFRRQHPLHYYVVDFYCHELKLAIEVDGPIHQRKDVLNHDRNRDAELLDRGIRTLRFSNQEVFHEMEKVLRRIKKFIATNSPSP